MSKTHFRWHFWPFQSNTKLFFLLNFFTKWPSALILDVRNSLLIEFLTISDQVFFLFVFTKWPAAPILDVQNALLIAFLAISDRYATLIFLEIFDKMAAVGHFGCPKFTLDRISGHFSSILNFYF